MIQIERMTAGCEAVALCYTPLPEDDENAPEPPEVVELKALIEQYREHFGEEPDWWALYTSPFDKDGQLREAIRTGQPIKLHLPPGCEA